MGSFDVACSVSRITINCGDPVAYFPLEVAKYPYEIEAHNNTLIYPWCYYIPLTLPIFGSYDDYGRIGYIKRDENVKTIERYFKCSIDDIADNCRVGKFSSIGMFVHKEIFDCMVENQIDDFGRTKTGKSFGTRSRYFYRKEYDKLRKRLVEDREIGERIKKLNKKIEKTGTKKDIELKNELHFKTLMRTLSENRDDGFFIHREYKIFNKLYKSCIEKGKLKKRLINMKFFETALFYANIHYFPAANGCQWGNHYGNRIVHQKALEILNEKIKEDEEERAKDE